MSKYNVIRFRFWLSHPSAVFFSIDEEIIDTLLASSSEDAMQMAKRRGHRAPIIALAKRKIPCAA